MRDFLETFVRGSEIVLVYYFFILNGVYLVLSLVSFRRIHDHMRRTIYGGYENLSLGRLTPGISIIVPAHNEEVSIALTVNNLLHVDYMRYEVIVVNDGSTDSTLEKLKGSFKLLPAEPERAGSLKTEPVLGVYRSAVHHNLVVVDKLNGGKSDALNAALNVCRHPYFCSIDADAILEPDALQRVIRPFMESSVRVIAVGGIVRVANGCLTDRGRIKEVGLSRSSLAVFQAVEYFRAFLAGRTALSSMNSLMIVSGAFGLFDRALVVEVGGYRRDTVGEDMDLVTRLHDHMRRLGRRDYLVEFVPDPVCWTEAPASLKVLTRQRRRWQKGLLEVLGEHLRMLFNPRYGWLGFFAYPFFFLFEGWGILVETLGYLGFILGWWLNALDADFMLAFFIVAILCGTLLSWTGILLGEMTPRPYPRMGHWLRLLAYGVIENFGYRQLVSFFRLLGTADYVLHAGSWGRMERQGMAKK